jgi:hypothetical protein
MLVKLRIQNPNDLPLDFNGVSVQLDVQGKRFATGVSDTIGSVPPFGETIVSVPVSISVFRIVRQAMDVVTDEYRRKLEYEMTGRLAGPAFNSIKGGVYVACGTLREWQVSRRFCDEQRKAVWVKVYPIKELPDSKEILDFLRKQLAIFNKYFNKDYRVITWVRTIMKEIGLLLMVRSLRCATSHLPMPPESKHSYMDFHLSQATAVFMVQSKTLARKN